MDNFTTWFGSTAGVQTLAAAAYLLGCILLGLFLGRWLSAKIKPNRVEPKQVFHQALDAKDLGDFEERQVLLKMMEAERLKTWDAHLQTVKEWHIEQREILEGGFKHRLEAVTGSYAHEYDQKVKELEDANKRIEVLTGMLADRVAPSNRFSSRPERDPSKEVIVGIFMDLALSISSGVKGWNMNKVVWICDHLRVIGEGATAEKLYRAWTKVHAVEAER